MDQKMQRRHFLKHAGALAAASGTLGWLGNLAATSHATAQTTGGDYRALVCIFLAGGNDAHNTVIPVDATSWRCYSASRDPKVMAQVLGIEAPADLTSIALDAGSLLNIGHRNAQGLNTGRSFALHPQLQRLRTLYGQSQAAVVANIGPLIRPTTKIDLLDASFELPPKLRSHNDQTAVWQSFQPEGFTEGWGGLMLDKLGALNANTSFGAIGVDATAVWLHGVDTRPYFMGASGYRVMGGQNGLLFGSSALYSAVRQAAGSRFSNSVLADDYASAVARAISAEDALRALPAAAQSPWGSPGTTALNDPLLFCTNPNDGSFQLNPLALQLQCVARMIAARADSGIGARRQIFMVTLGGFDTHNDLLRQHGLLMARLDHAVGYFQNCLAQMPGGDLRSQVTTFTASEFGRGLINNGDGCDHGWGGHHFIVGGAVKGGDIYGRFPQFMAFDNEGDFYSDQLLKGGVLLPEVSVDQLVYTLGRWMGVTDADLLTIAPNLVNFDTGSRDLGFMA
jgi:uncharacterized protein (DUF1501 family)